MKPDLSHVTTWLFDLDHTLYPFECDVMHRVEARMSAFVAREVGLSPEDAYQLQKRYLNEHGTTLAGLMKHHDVEPRRFLDDVHDVPLDGLEPDYELNALITRLPGRKIVFTNGDSFHAGRLLKHMDMEALFDGVFHLEHANYVPKPNLVTFELMMKAHIVTPAEAAFFEDSPRNLKPAHGLGMRTILVGPHAADNLDGFVDFRSPSLKHFLSDYLD